MSPVRGEFSPPFSVKGVVGVCGENSAFRRTFVARPLLSVSVYELRYFGTWNLVSILIALNIPAVHYILLWNMMI